jgi:hypothetical protein
LGDADNESEGRMRRTLEDVVERAAIMEYDGGINRSLAETRALENVFGETRQMPWRFDDIIFASSPPDDESVAAAKAFISEQGLSKDDVSLRRSEHAVYVITKREILDGQG